MLRVYEKVADDHYNKMIKAVEIITLHNAHVSIHIVIQVFN